MSNDHAVDAVFLIFQVLVLVISLVTLWALARGIKNEQDIHIRLPALVYCGHVSAYYILLLLSHTGSLELFDSVAMAWSIALRLHAAIMLLSYARWWVKCPKK